MAIENTYPHQQIDINGISTNIIEAGNKKNQLFYSAWLSGKLELDQPCNGPIKRKLSYFISGYRELGNQVNCSSDKFTIASFIQELIHTLIYWQSKTKI